MTTEQTKESVEKSENDLAVTATVFTVKFTIVFVIVGVLAGIGKLFYGLSDASKELIAQAAKDECMKAHILAYSAENGPINKSTLWDYAKDCELKKQYQRQIELIAN